MLHGILPYPTFLIDERSVALRLGVSTSSLRVALKRDPAFRRLLSPAAYRGILSEFLGNRWWRAGIDSILWIRTKGSPDPTVLTNDIVKRFSHLEPLELAHPVVLLDKDLRPSDDVADFASAVEIRPDGWPTYADHAWIALQDAIDDERLRALVVETDVDRVIGND
jgi:hypothetical protein